MRFGTAKPNPAHMLVQRADLARDQGRFADAATLYREALLIDPDKAGIHVQAGNMLKDIGDLAAAERHYLRAVELRPDDADVAVQLGHLFKVSGRLREAAAAYEHAVSLSPGWAPPAEELADMRRSGWGSGGTAQQPVPAAASGHGLDELRLAGLYGRLSPENLPKPLAELLHMSEPSINIRQLGVRLNTFWGMMPVLRGIEAIRGFCLSFEPIHELQVRVNGLIIHRGTVDGPFELEYEPDKDRIHKYTFNVWSDFTDFAPGRYELELTLVANGGPGQVQRMDFVVEPALDEADHPTSDGLITLPPGGRGTLEEQINARPSIVHPAERRNMLPHIRSILVSRADQLGDLVASIPAIERLREIFPNAKLVGIFSPANVDLARTLDLFDDIIVLDLRESLHQRTRTLTLEEQEALRDRLAPYRFDIAIDLSQSLMSRPLLALSGASFLYGFNDPNWPRLTASVDDAYHDPKNHREIATHSTRVLTMIERLEQLHCSSARIIRRDDLGREGLARYGIVEGDRFAVLHTGARIVFSRWPYYLGLAERLLADTDLKIAIFTTDPRLKDTLPAALAGSDRVIVLDGLLPFDEFDAFLSHCAVYVGNDSGPKHLASLRGVPVVSIHSARINWSEWGQEHSGVIVTRKVPCAGCLLYHDVDECGKDYVCITGISLDDVYSAVRRYV